MPPKQDFNHPTHKLWIFLDQTYFATSKCQEAAFAKAGLTLQQYRVLMIIDSSKGPVTPTDVAHWLDRNTNSISLLVDRMEKVDLVKRVRDLKDRRSQRLVMTPKGRKLFDQATEHGLALREKMLSCCTGDELNTLINLLDKLREGALKELMPENEEREAKIKGLRNIARFMRHGGEGEHRDNPHV